MNASDKWGEPEHVKRPSTEWLRVDAPHLRIVTDAQWAAAHARIDATRAIYRPDIGGHVAGRAPSGVVAKHLLTGLATCATCGGGLMGRHAGQLTLKKYTGYYICTAFNNHGATGCANNVPLPMQTAEAAVLSTFLEFVLRPDIVEGAIRDAVQLLRPSGDTLAVQRTALQAKLSAVEEELVRLATAVATGGQLTPLLDAIQDRERNLRQVRQQLDELDALRQVSEFDVRKVERELRTKLDDCRGLLQRNTPIARQVMTKLLDGRLVFTPRPDRGYEFTGKVHFGKFLKGFASPQVVDGLPGSPVRDQRQAPELRAPATDRRSDSSGGGPRCDPGGVCRA